MYFTEFPFMRQWNRHHNLFLPEDRKNEQIKNLYQHPNSTELTIIMSNVTEVKIYTKKVFFSMEVDLNKKCLTAFLKPS